MRSVPRKRNLSRDDRIKLEIERLKQLLTDVPENKLSAAEGLIKRVAFMAITLEDLEKDMNENGTVEPFSQGGGPPYDRQRPAAQIYNTTVKNYTTACKQLTDLIPAGPPPKEAPKEKDALEKILDRQGKRG